jgi:DnaJ-domain-containing protein 1
MNEARPCKWASCKYHHGINGSALCVLDVADSGERTLEEVADLIGLSKERVRQIEWIAFKKLRRLKVLR